MHCRIAIFQSLQTLDMSFNTLGDSCIQSLSTLLKDLPLLATLKLKSCSFTEKLFHQHRMMFAASMQGNKDYWYFWDCARRLIFGNDIQWNTNIMLQMGSMKWDRTINGTTLYWHIYIGNTMCYTHLGSMTP